MAFINTLFDNFWFESIIRLILGFVLAGIIGAERQSVNKPAGFKTHSLIGVSSVLIMLCGEFLSTKYSGADASRIPAQLLSGIGFIGAGTIILQKQVVRGLTTAAGIWATSGIGLAVGAGMYGIGIVATVLVLIGLETLSFFFKSMGMRNMMIEFSAPNKEAIRKVSSNFNSKNYVVVSYEMTEIAVGGDVVYRVTMVIKAKRMNEEGLLLMFLQDFPDITVNKII